MEKETPKNGTHKVYYGNGRKSDTPFHGSTEVVKNYINGLLHGKVIRNGGMKRVVKIKQGKVQEGQFVYTGRLEYECNYKNGLKDGIEIYWHYMGKYKRLENTYKKGFLDGKTTFWGYPSANVKEAEINYKNGMKDGKTIRWFGNYEKESESDYKNGMKDGKFILWYYNKQKRSEEVFKNDVRQGKPKYWYPNGKEKDEDIVELERIAIEEQEGDINEYFVHDCLNADECAEYEKNYEGYDFYGDGTIEGIPQDDHDPFYEFRFDFH